MYYYVINLRPQTDNDRVNWFSDYRTALASYNRQVSEGGDVMIVRGEVLDVDQNSTQNLVWGWKED